MKQPFALLLLFFIVVVYIITFDECGCVCEDLMVVSFGLT